MHKLIFFLLALTIYSCTSTEAQNTINEQDSAEYRRDIVDFKGFQDFALQEDGQLKLINFWATWCAPCVEELPHFLEVYHDKKSDDFSMCFVTLDRARDMDTKVIPFAEKNDMNADILLLDDVKNMNTWIRAVDSTWTGSIPATVLYRDGKKLEFIEGQLSKEELLALITKHQTP